MENQVLHTIKTRRSIRAYKDDALTKDQLDTLLHAALHAPSSLNRRTWHLNVVTDRQILQQLDADLVELLLRLGIPALTERVRSRGNTMIYNAPALIVITAKDTHGYEDKDGGVMAQTIALAAKSMGIDSVIIGVLDKIFADPTKGPLYTEKLRIPPEHRFVLSVALGHANQEPIKRELTFDDKVTFV